MTTNVDQSRRNFLRGKKPTIDPAFRLPWITSENAFINDCTKCNDCLSACEENIIVKGADGYPKIDFDQGECTFCQDCISSCNQTFFKEDKTGQAWPSKFNIKDNCLAKNSVYCQSCKDACESRAISFAYVDGAIPQPQVSQDLCTGCGACIKPCPTNSTELLLFKELK